MPQLTSFDEFKLGSVLKIFYMLVLNKHRKLFVITGICTQYRKKQRTFSLSVFHGKELVKYDFQFGAPSLIWVEVLKSYNLEHTIHNFHHFKPISVHARSDKVLSKPVVSVKDPYNYLFKQGLTPSERSRLRRKFRV